MSAWIEIIAESEADSALLEKLDQVRAPNGTVDNVMKVHSLRPQTMIGHHSLYMSVLHHPDNTLPSWLLETIASYTSLLNRCSYSFANHWSNAAHLIGNDRLASKIHNALQHDKPEQTFSGKELAILQYTKRLTVSPGDICKEDIEALRKSGLDDGQILEVNQVCCYFNYVNRQLNGLGVTLEGDKIGYYSS